MAKKSVMALLVTVLFCAGVSFGRSARAETGGGIADSHQDANAASIQGNGVAIDRMQAPVEEISPVSAKHPASHGFSTNTLAPGAVNTAKTTLPGVPGSGHESVTDPSTSHPSVGSSQASATAAK